MKDGFEIGGNIGMHWVIFAVSALLCFVAFVPGAIWVLIGIAVVALCAAVVMNVMGYTVDFEARFHDGDGGE